MLDPNALNAAIGVTQDLGSRGVKLGAFPDTPLAILVRETPTVGISPESSDYQSAIAELVELSRDEEHGEVMTDTVQLSAETVRRTLDYTRNTVMPHLRSVMEAHQAAVEALESPPLPFNIVTVYQPEIYKTDVAANFLERWANTPAITPPAPTSLGYYTAEEVLSLAKLSNDTGFNGSMEKLLNANGGKGIQAIIDVLKGSLSVQAIDDTLSLPLALVLMNIDTPKEGVAMTMTQYNATRATMANIAGKKALVLQMRLNHALTTNNVYFGNQITPGVITVCGEVYRLFLDKGLTTEALIGNEMLNRKYRGVQMLEADALAECTAMYERDRDVRAQAHVMNKRKLSRQALLDVLRNDQKRIAAEGAFTVEGDTAEKSWGRLRDFMSAVMGTIWADAEPSTIIAAAVCRVWYTHTDAWRFIDIMFDIEKNNKGLPVKELATLATLRYIAEWVASQVVVIKQDVDQPTA